MNEFLDQVYYHNTVRDYLTVAGIILFSILILRVFKRIFINRLRALAARTEGKIDDFIIDGIDRFGLPVIQFSVIYWGLNFLDLSSRAEDVIKIATTIVVTYFILRFLSSVILLVLQSHILKQEHGQEKIKQLGGLMLVINIVIWVLGIIFVLENVGQDVSTLVAGLGIGGIAIALAAQNILGDLFNYFVIYFDRPFEVGDFIVVDDKSGTVEYLGIKTTRIRSISGEQIIIGNSNLTGSRIHNFKRLINRRIVFTINVDHRTPLDKMKLIPGLLKTIVEQQKPVLFDRAHFASFGDWSLKYEVVYFVLDGDFNKYMDIQQNINFRIKEVLEQNGIFIVSTPHTSLIPQPPAPAEGEIKK
ncbi:MAG TPA: mechanosensitive ion channel family protein [Chryseosolibacter sp.]